MGARIRWVLGALLTVWMGSGCGDIKQAEEDDDVSASGSDSDNRDTSDMHEPIDVPVFDDGPAAGNPDGKCPIPSEARLDDTSKPDQVIGDGTKQSCTGQAVIDAVAAGGVITFNCGPDPVVITLERPAKVFNDANPVVTIDGGGLITLSGGGKNRILYMNTCDEDQHWTTSHCDNQDHPRLTVQNLTFANGNSKGEKRYDGGGAIYASGGRLKVVNSRFFNNACADTGADVGGGAIRVFQQFEGRPVYVVNTTFGGTGELGNVCSNGGGLSSIGVSWTILNSLFTYNRSVGNGGNPAREGTPGGGSGGAIYNDGLTMELTLCGSLLEHNRVNAYGSSIFFVSNNHKGTINFQSTISRNNEGGSWDHILPGVSMHDDTRVNMDDQSIIE